LVIDNVASMGLTEEEVKIAEKSKILALVFFV